MAVSEKKKANKAHLKYANGNLKTGAVREAVETVIQAIDQGRPKGEVIVAIQEKYGIRQETAWQLFSQGESEFLQRTGFSKPQIKHMIHKRALQTLADKEANSTQVSSAARLLTSIFHLEEEKPTEDKAEKVRLWKNVFDHASVEEIDDYLRQFESGTFKLDEINEGVADTIINRAKK